MWIKSLLQDGHNGSISSKRVITMLAFLTCMCGFIADTFGYRVNPHLYDSMMYIVIAGLGFTASEKFTSNKQKGII